MSAQGSISKSFGNFNQIQINKFIETQNQQIALNNEIIQKMEYFINQCFELMQSAQQEIQKLRQNGNRMQQQYNDFNQCIRITQFDQTIKPQTQETPRNAYRIKKNKTNNNFQYIPQLLPLNQTSQINKKCYHCNNEIQNNQYYQTQCNHIFHLQCYLKLIEKQITNKQDQFKCQCSALIKYSEMQKLGTYINQNDIIYYIFQSQLDQIISDYSAQQFSKCKNCNFIWIKQNNELCGQQECPNMKIVDKGFHTIQY